MVAYGFDSLLSRARKLISLTHQLQYFTDWQTHKQMLAGW